MRLQDASTLVGSVAVRRPGPVVSVRDHYDKVDGVFSRVRALLLARYGDLGLSEDDFPNGGYEREMFIDEAATFLGVSLDFIYREVASGSMPGFKISNRLRFRKSELILWKEEQRVGRGA